MLGSNLASEMDFKLHSSCCDFGGNKTFTTSWLGCRVKVWVQVWAKQPDSQAIKSYEASKKAADGAIGQWYSNESTTGQIKNLDHIALICIYQHLAHHVKVNWILNIQILDDGLLMPSLQVIDLRKVETEIVRVTQDIAVPFDCQWSIISWIMFPSIGSRKSISISNIQPSVTTEHAIQGCWQ